MAENSTTQYYNILNKYFDIGSKADELYLILRYNSQDIHNLITTAGLERYKNPQYMGNRDRVL